jgi:hypothetical protein
MKCLTPFLLLIATAHGGEKKAAIISIPISFGLEVGVAHSILARHGRTIIEHMHVRCYQSPVSSFDVFRGEHWRDNSRVFAAQHGLSTSDATRLAVAVGCDTACTCCQVYLGLLLELTMQPLFKLMQHATCVLKS